MLSYNINNMNGQTSSYNYKGGRYIIDRELLESKLLQQPLGNLEGVLFNMTEKIIKTVDEDGRIRAAMELLVRAHPEDRGAYIPKFEGRYLLLIRLLDHIGLDIVGCGSAGSISKSDIEITCLEYYRLSQTQVFYPAENIHNSILEILHLMYGRAKDVLKDPNMPINFYEVLIRALINPTKKPDNPKIGVSNETLRMFVYDNRRSMIGVVCALNVPDY